MWLQLLCLILIASPPPLPAPGGVAGAAAGSTAQKPASPGEKPPKPAAQLEPDDLPVDIDRIQRALANTPRLRFDEKQRPVFRVEVFGAQPTMDDILGPDWTSGPVPHGSLTHREFLALVTPEDVQGSAAFSSGQGATVAATSFLFQWTLRKAVQRFNETRDERARAAARQEVMEALEALEQARAKAGLGAR